MIRDPLPRTVTVVADTQIEADARLQDIVDLIPPRGRRPDLRAYSIVSTCLDVLGDDIPTSLGTHKNVDRGKGVGPHGAGQALEWIRKRLEESGIYVDSLEDIRNLVRVVKKLRRDGLLRTGND